MRPGIYRRRLFVSATANEVRADLEDDLHRHGVTLRHDGRRITAIEGRPLRTPWSLCPASVAPLVELVGMPLSLSARAVYQQTDGFYQCTHMLDLAGLAVAQAARGPGRRRYDAAVDFTDFDGPRSAMLNRDGDPLLEWTLDGVTIAAPEPFAGHKLRSLLDWADAAFTDPDMREAIFVLWRAAYISNSRRIDVDAIPSPTLIPKLRGACYVFQPGTAEQSRRNQGTIRDFTGEPEKLLEDLPEIPGACAAPHRG